MLALILETLSFYISFILGGNNFGLVAMMVDEENTQPKPPCGGEWGSKGTLVRTPERHREVHREEEEWMHQGVDHNPSI